MVPDSLKMQRFLCIFIIRAAWSCGPRIIENKNISLYFHGLGRVVKGAGGSGIDENMKISLDVLVSAA